MYLLLRMEFLDGRMIKTKVKPNRFIEALIRGPCTREELPYAIKGGREREHIFTIHMTGTRSHTRGKFKTVYYLVGYEAAAIDKFIEVNQDILMTLNWGTYNVVDSSLPKWQARAIRDRVR